MTIIFNNRNHEGYVFSDFYPKRSPETGPGWYVFGRNAKKYGTLDDGRGSYIMLCARPDVPARKHPHYNIKVHRGFRTQREAQEIADHLNRVWEIPLPVRYASKEYQP